MRSSYDGHNEFVAGLTSIQPSKLGPVDPSLVPFKSGERKKIEQSGYFIIANIGDQQSDLEGGFAKCRFKLPDPFYFIP